MPEPYATNLTPPPFIILAGPDVLEGEDGRVNLEAARVLQDIAERLSRDWDIRFYFKSSYDKANRTSINAYRGPGWEKGLPMLARIKEAVGCRIITDVHNLHEVAPAAAVADMIQIPAFLSRQTDLLVAAGRTGVEINLKKGQFLSPQDILHGAEKIRSTGNHQIVITERGTTFGYNNLVVDMRAFPIVQGQGYPMIFDATHSVQLPGGQGSCSGGQREFVTTLARAAVAAGASGLFMETHPDPDRAPCDGPNMIPLAWVEDLLVTCLKIRAIVQSAPAPVLPALAAT